MGFIGFVKCMKLEDNCPIDVTFRTSRASTWLGGIFILCGVCILWQITFGFSLPFRSSSLLALGVPISAFFLSFGAVLLMYRKHVVISKRNSMIEIVESGIFRHHHAKFHFKDILHIEVCPIDECLFSSKWVNWTVKIYARRNDGFEACRLFESLEFSATEKAGLVLSQILCHSIVDNSKNNFLSSFTSPVLS